MTSRLLALLWALGGCSLAFDVEPSGAVLLGESPDAGSWTEPDTGSLDAPDAASWSEPDASATPDASPPTPVTPCSVYEQTGCSTSQACYYAGAGDEGACHGIGNIDRTGGGYCVAQWDCVPGGVCTDNHCEQVCQDQADCGECTATTDPELRVCG